MKRLLAIVLMLLFAPAVHLPAQDIASEYRELWAKAKDAYDGATGYRSAIIPLTADQLSSNAPDYEEGLDMGAMLDGDPNTFWHSDWHNEVQETHYIEIVPSQPVEGDIALFVKRRKIYFAHPTLLGCYGSNDGESWTEIGDFSLGNAASGASVTSNVLPLGDAGYRMLRLYLRASTEGYIFGHFAELRLLSMARVGEATEKDVSTVKDALFWELVRGYGIPDQAVTDEMLLSLQTAYDGFRTALGDPAPDPDPNPDPDPEPEKPTTDEKQRTDVPTLVINTYDGTDVDSRSQYKYARMFRLDGDSVAVYDSLRIRGRGNSTWGMAKKPYRLKFHKKEKFLGKGKANAKNWTLLANYGDKTLLRNATASFIAKVLGQPFAPAAEFVDLVLNGEYLGNYQVSDQVEVKKKRVDIYEQEMPPVGDDADISGGYLIEFDGFAYSEPVHFSTDLGTPVTIKSPDDDVITPRQKAYIADFVNEFERRVFSDNYTDPDEGYRSMVDSMTLASWFLATEYTGNVDGYWSTYAYKDRGDGRLFWGPMWDHDIAFNNCDRRGTVTDRLMVDAAFEMGMMKGCVQRIYSDKWFRNLIARQWRKAVQEDRLVERTIAYVDSMSAVINESQRLNFQKWSLSQHVYNEIVLFSTYQEGVDYLKTFLREHADFLSSQFLDPGGVVTPDPDPNPGDPFEVDENALYYIYNVNVGKVADVIDYQDFGICTWDKDESRKDSQSWKFVPAGGDCYRIVMKDTQMAITDMASPTDGGYATGSTLGLLAIDEEDGRQLWEFVPTAGNYSIANVATGLAWNNSGGNAADGNPIISWTNDAQNAAKPTRQWRFEKVVGGSAPTSVGQADVEYRVGYDPVAQVVALHLPVGAVADTKAEISVYDAQGRLQGRGDALTPVSVAHLPAGTYVASWNVQGSRHSVKFVKQ